MSGDSAWRKRGGGERSHPIDLSVCFVILFTGSLPESSWVHCASNRAEAINVIADTGTSAKPNRSRASPCTARVDRPRVQRLILNSMPPITFQNYQRGKDFPMQRDLGGGMILNKGPFSNPAYSVGGWHVLCVENKSIQVSYGWPVFSKTFLSSLHVHQ